MNIDNIYQVLQERFREVDRLRGLVFRARLRYGDEPFALYLFDCTEAITEQGFDVRPYQDELLREEYYRVPGSLQWNMYCYFICDEEDFRILKARGVVDAIEGDRSFARKYVRTPKSLREEFLSLDRLTTKVEADIPVDIGSLWQQTLEDEGLSVVSSSLSYVDTVERIVDGEDLEESERNEVEEDAAGLRTFDAIEQLLLRDFRVRPHKREFEFGDCNLISGANGSGKTTVLEAIEAWVCGRHYRNPDDKIQPGSVEVRVRDGAELVPGPVDNVSLYRRRDHLWYGNYQVRRNQLCFNFARFNFYNADAGARLEISESDKEARQALSRLVLGEVAARIMERIERVLPRIQKIERELKMTIDTDRNTIKTATQTIESLESPTDSRQRAHDHLRDQLPRRGWKAEVPGDSEEEALSCLDSIVTVATVLSTSIEEVNWLRPVTMTTLTAEKEALESCCSQASDLVAEAEQLQRELQEFGTRSEDLATDQALIGRRLEYARSGASELLDHEIREGKARARRDALLKIRDDLRVIDLRPYAEMDESSAEVSSRLRNELSRNETAVVKQRQFVASLEARHGRIASLLSEIRARANEVLRADPDAKVCPVCGAVYAKGELLERVHQELSETAQPSLQEAHDALSIREKEVERLTKSLLDLKVLESAAMYADELGVPILPTLRGLWEFAASVDGHLRRCEIELESMERKRSELEVRGFSEDELRVLESELQARLPTTTAVDESTLERMLVEVRDQQARADTRRKACESKKITLGSRLADMLDGVMRKKGATYDEVTARTEIVHRNYSHVVDQLRHVDLSHERPLSDVLLNIQELRDMLEGYLRLRQKEESVVQVIEENRRRIEMARAEIDGKTPVHKRVESAIAVLESMQEDGADRHCREFLSTHLQQVSSLFRLIHTPKEFDRIEWINDELAAVPTAGPRDGRPCSVTKLSSGQRNALSLSVFLTMNRIVSQGPQILMLDDPVAHVDDLNVVSLLDVMRELLSGLKRQVFFATASGRTASLFRKKFDYLGDGGFFEHRLAP